MVLGKFSQNFFIFGKKRSLFLDLNIEEKTHKERRPNVAQDELGTVLELEVNGFRYMLKGLIETIKLMIRQINAFHNWKNVSHSSGSHSWSYIKAWSKETPQVIQIPENIPEDVWKDFCKKNNIPYCDSIPDFDLTDRRKPVLFRSQDVVMIQQLIQPYVDELNKELETEKSHYEQLEDKLNETIRTSSNPEEIKKAKVDLENVQCAKEQLQRVIDKNDEYTKNGNTMSFFDYLKQGVNTEIEDNPSLALAKLNEGIEISKNYTLADAMMLVRDPSLVPEEKTIHLTSLNDGNEIYIKREFSFDDNGLAVCNSTIFKDGQEVGSFNDKGLSPANYSEKLKKAITKAGITEAEFEQLSFRTDLSKVSYDAYKDFEINPENVLQEASRENKTQKDDYLSLGEKASASVVAATEENKSLYSGTNAYKMGMELSDEAQRFRQVLTANRVQQTDAIKSNMFEINLDSSQLFMIEGIPSYNIDGIGMVVGVEQRKDAEGNFTIAIHNDRKYEVMDEEGNTKTLSGGEIRGKMNSIKEANYPTEKQTLSMGRAR